MDRILQGISAVGRKLEGMDSAMASSTAETKSMRLDIAGFQSQVTGLDQRVTLVETHIASWVDRDQELLYLRSKPIDLEDRHCRDNVRFLGFPENIKSADITSYLRETLPKLTGITFDPPLEFQRVHRLGPKQRDDTNPRPIIACLLRHVQTRQLLQASRAHGPFLSDDLEVRLMGDFSKETSERRRAFLALRPYLRQLDVKNGLFELAKVWITKNRVSQDFYDPEDLQVFLDELQNQTQSMDSDLDSGHAGTAPECLFGSVDTFRIHSFIEVTRFVSDAGAQCTIGLFPLRLLPCSVYTEGTAGPGRGEDRVKPRSSVNRVDYFLRDWNWPPSIRRPSILLTRGARKLPGRDSREGKACYPQAGDEAAVKPSLCLYHGPE
ncbi:hypothetical protein NDU88_007283 [Pleurodeles waltl]|uniref:Uncharacterized protein n=1 Tax=Pleurodeles waltl TaxID=8319 RepID=A0AAV7N1N3_PLEWA|nr:hypothetical protein NDU88_007283 [Pleurodeles waltl]